MAPSSENLDLQTTNSISCAQRCVNYVTSGEECNAFSYNQETLTCELANITFLEDPLEDGSDGGEKRIMLAWPEVDLLPRVCRGGEHCCGPDSPCSLGEGDCNSDQDCAGVSVCGRDNCVKSGGRWDPSDDCCSRRCTGDSPCQADSSSIDMMIMIIIMTMMMMRRRRRRGG